MMCCIVATLRAIWIWGSYTGGYCRTAHVPKPAIRRQWGKLPSANYANRSTILEYRAGTRPNSTSAAKLDQQGAKPLTKRGISTCFRFGRLNWHFANTAAGESTSLAWKTLSLWTAGG